MASTSWKPRQRKLVTTSNSFAEIDLLCALSTCPGGDLSTWGWGEGSGGNMKDVCRPIKVEVFELEDSALLDKWNSPKRPDYKGVPRHEHPTR